MAIATEIPGGYRTWDELIVEAMKDHRGYVERFFKIRHRDARLGLVPFQFLPAQDDYWKTHSSRDISVKARQIAFSSVVNADFTADAMLHPNIVILNMVQTPEEQHLPAHRNRVQTFIDSVPKEAMVCEQTMDNQRHIELKFPNGEKSHIFFAAYGSADIGQGETINRAHLTEFSAAEPEQAEEMLTNLLGMPLRNSRIVIEARPNGAKGKFYETYLGAKRGQNTFKPHFYEWFWEPSYRAGPSILAGSKLSEREQWLVREKNLSLEQIAWRRMMIKEATAAAGPEKAEAKFLEQYAEDDVSAFLLSGFHVFDQLYLERLSRDVDLHPPVAESSHIRIWEKPVPGECYVIGADPAMGLEHSDRTAAIVRNARTWKHCATVVGHIAPREFAGILNDLAIRYNGATINPERNNNAFGVLNLLIDYFRYPNVYLHQTVVNTGGDDQYGYPVSAMTKPNLVSQLRDMVASHEWLSWDKELLEEMRMLEEKDGKYSGESDDLPSAELMCIAARAFALRSRGAIPRGPRVVTSEY